MSDVYIKTVNGGEDTAPSGTDAIELDDGSTSKYTLLSNLYQALGTGTPSASTALLGNGSWGTLTFDSLTLQGADIAAATTTNIGAATGYELTITGNTTITAFDSVAAGILRVLKFTGTPLLTYNATTLILPGGSNYQVVAGDVITFVSEGSGNWRCIGITMVNGPLTITNTLGADVALNNTGTFFDGPSCAQGTVGKWFASGYVTLSDTGGSTTFRVKLWDGTTVIASGVYVMPSAGSFSVVHLSGYISSPAGNIKISVKDTARTTGVIYFNNSAESKDSSLSVMRVDK